MPFKSKQQAKLFYAAANKKGGIGDLSQETAKKFIKDTSGQKIGKLPRFAKLKEKVKKK